MDRFWSKVNKTSTCWEWTSALNHSGYGHFTLDKKVRRAHRVSAYLAGLITDLSDKRCVLHRCDNRKCVNPDHLFVGSQEQNLLDMRNKGRHANGEQVASKLTKADVVAIRADTRPHTQIAADYDVTYSYISMIQTRKRWRHVS